MELEKEVPKEEVLMSRFSCKSDGEKCGSCGLVLYSGISVKGVAGIYCDVLCLEAHLFGYGCRWCGVSMEKSYTTVDSRLCSEDCSEGYYAHVIGDRTARVGTGQRFVVWLRKNRPLIYRELVNAPRESGACQNLACTRGDSGTPATLAHLRSNTRFCSESCKKQSGRSQKAA